MRKKWPVAIKLCERLTDRDWKEGHEQTGKGGVRRILHKNGKGGDLKIGHREGKTRMLVEKPALLEEAAVQRAWKSSRG